MNVLVLDIETNMAHDTIWCCAYHSNWFFPSKIHVETPESIAGLKSAIKGADVIVGHNIIGFDGPLLSRLWGVQIPISKVRDTLVMSRLWNPQLEGGHSLRAWGERLGDFKDDFTDFDGGLTQEMIEYCKQDVHVTTLLYDKLSKELSSFGGSVHLEHRVAWLMKKQEDNGFKLDVPQAVTLLAQLKDRMSVITDEMQAVFPPIVEERWSEKTGKQLKDRVTVFNVGSRKQIAERLQSIGVKFTKKTEKGSIIVDEGTLKSIDKPEAQLIAEYLMLQKRVGLLDSWIDNVKDDGRVHGRVITNGAVTGRMTHHSPNMGQIPSVNSEYGSDCRKLWTVDDGNVLCGTDLSGIELRCLAHYMQDADWTEELLNGDIHQKNADAAGVTRPQAKTLIYATLYGAGPAKIGSIVGGGAREGSEVLQNFYRNTPALSRLMEKVKKVASKGYVPGLDGRRILVRSEHAALNSLLQGCGAIIAKQWCIEAHKEFKRQRLSVQQVAFVHDEIQIEAQRPHAETVASIMVASARKAGEVLGFRCPVDAEAKIGNNWFDTH
jgi:DNA polymerase I-like protein with 3'-5' exonuclease and polymerase domains